MNRHAVKKITYLNEGQKPFPTLRGARSFGMPVCPNLTSYIDDTLTDSDRIRIAEMFLRNSNFGMEMISEDEFLEGFENENSWN